MDEILVPVSPGELIDKLTILEIKQARISDAGKLANVRREKAALDATAAARLPATEALAALRGELRAINEALWEIEDAIRHCDRAGDFGPRFIELAQSVYRTNDRRAAVKKRINLELGSALVEEKSYADHGGAA